MSSTSHPAKSSAGAGATSTDTGRRGSGNVDDENALRRSTRLASKSKSNPSTSTSRTPSEEAKSTVSSLNPKGPKKSLKRSKKEETAETEPPLTAAENRRTRRGVATVVAPAKEAVKKPPTKRRASSVEQSDDEEEETEEVPATAVSERKASLRHRAVVSEPPRTLRARKVASQKGEHEKSSRMGAALHKSEAPAAGSSSEEDASSKPKPLTRSRSTRVAAAPTTDVIKDKEPASDTIAQRVRRTHVDKRNPNKSSAVAALKRAVTPVPPAPPSGKIKKDKEKKTTTSKLSGTSKGTGSSKSKTDSSTAKEGKADTTGKETGATGISSMAQNNSNKAAGTDPAGLANSVFSALGDLESMSAEEFDVTRLQALLEARGLPSSLFSNLAPRFQQMLGRIGSQAGGSTQCYNKCTQLLTSLKGTDESAQLAAASELCQMLVMGNEDTLHGFPIKQAVAALTSVIGGEGNYELVTQACRALSYMMESLPRSSAIVTGAIPAFLEKLQSIEYIDVAEQSLVALEMLSRRHAKQILRANGVQAVLNYIEFFSSTAQRNALMITSGCCSNLTPEEFEFVQPVLPLLSQRISQDTDKKCVENTCAAFSRIVDCFRNDADRLREIASHGLLQNIQHLLVVSPSVLSSQTFIMVMQMLTNICTACPDLAAHLLDNKITETLCFLLTGSPTVGNRIELSKSARSPQEGYELIRLIVALLPDLPCDGLFAVDDLLRKVSGASDHQVVWFWKDDSNAWIPYTNAESATIETGTGVLQWLIVFEEYRAAHANAFRTHQEDILIDTPQAQYVIDLVAMHQINEDTGTSREVRRQEMAPVPKPARPQGPAAQSTDPNVFTFIRHIFGVLYEVYSTSAGAAIRHKCSEALLKMTYHASPDLLTAVMQRLPISSNIASNLATSDIKSVIYAIQLSDILMQKLPQTFPVHFRREGVVYQMNLCAKGESVIFKHQNETPFGPTIGSDVVISGPVEFSQASSSAGLAMASLNQPRTRAEGEPTDPATEGAAAASARARVQPSSTRKAASRARLAALTTTRRRHQAGPSEAAANTEPAAVPALAPVEPPPPPAPPGPAATSALNRIAISRRLASEGRAMLDRLSSSLGAQSTGSHPAPPVPPSPAALQNHRHQATEWIKTQAQKFLAGYFPSLGSSQSGSLAVLIAAVEKLRTEKELSALKEIKQVILDGNASPFEVIHSNAIGVLLKYLTESEWQDEFDLGVVKRAKRKAKFESNGTPRRLRLLRFLHVFFDGPSQEDVENSFMNVFDISDAIDSVPPFQALVSKMGACLNQLEQYPVRVTDLTTPGLVGMGASGGRHPIMRVFAHNQLKCTLSRHPDSPNIRQWRGGMVRVEPLAPIYTIERYLVTRGCARTVTVDDAAPDTDEVSDEDELDSMSMAADAARNNGQYRLELLYNNNVLPYNWSLFQCIRHYARATGEETEGDSDFGAGQMALFTNTHTIHYRLVAEENSAQAAKAATGQQGSPVVKADEEKRTGVWDTGIAPLVDSSLDGQLISKLPDYVTVSDPSLETITLIRVLFALNYHWPDIYQPQSKLLPRLGEYDFLNAKLVTKMNRQLQDPMMILTGQIPSWMAQIAVFAPFLFPFESRLQLFYVTAFDRDRAMQRLLDANPDLAASRSNNQPSSSQGHDHMLPRIERRKRMVSRKNLLAQTQTIMDEFAQGRQFLEIQYQDEVGTGLGPTLEFYSMVSKEFQRIDLGLWHNACNHASTGLHVYAPCGLFPKPLGHGTSKARITEVEGKFRLLGKFMAKALMDFRMTDIPFSPVFYKWLLSEESKLGLADVAHIDPEIAKHLEKLHRIARRKKWLENVNESGDRKRTSSDEELLYDGSKIEDLCLTYTLPGYDEVELCKGGHDKAVTLDQLDHYVNLVVHWFLREGVYRQMEAFREAFNAIVPLKYIQLFRAEEMDALFCGHGEHLQEGWDVRTLTETCHPDHGYSVDSQAIKWLFSIMAKYNAQERRDFVQFVTGSPKLPVGGFRSLNPPFTVVKKTVAGEQSSDQFLPSVMTCVNYLKLPDYTTLEIMKMRLEVACKEGQHSFHLS